MTSLCKHGKCFVKYNSIPVYTFATTLLCTIWLYTTLQYILATIYHPLCQGKQIKEE